MTFIFRLHAISNKVCIHPAVIFSPFRGTFKAVDHLLVGRFLNMPAEGEWTLGLLDTVADGSNGTVASWSLDIEMRPCDWRSALRLVVVLDGLSS